MYNIQRNRTGMTDFMISSGLITPIDEIPTADFAVPYAAPSTVKICAEAAPI
uniref:Uncharacterized protein n=1 Tax=Parascaris univalens TaxID=6257 RepID=A0A915AVR4_PARUN